MAAEQRFDSMWTNSHHGWVIHGKYDRQLTRDVIDIQRPNGTFLKHGAKSLYGAQRAINRAIKREAAH